MIDEAEGAQMGDLPGGTGQQFSYDVSKGIKASAARAGKGEMLLCRARVANSGRGARSEGGGREGVKASAARAGPGEQC